MVRFGTTDTAQSLMLTRSSNQLKSTVSKLTAELSSGQHSDISRALNGTLKHVADMEHGIRLSAQNVASADVISTLLSAQQQTLSRLGALTQGLAADFQISTQTGNTPALAGATARAATGFEDAIGLLNTKTAGRYLFSGTTGDVKPFAAPGTILNALISSLPPTTSPADIRDHVQSWFATGGGFDTVAYLGGNAANSAIRLGGGISVRNDLTGEDQAIRDSLAGLALGAIGEILAPSLPASDQHTLLTMGATALFAADASRIALEATVGATEARVASARIEEAAKGSALQIARTELLAVDPYETATALEAATQRLDALYLITARLSRLSLTEYLR